MQLFPQAFPLTQILQQTFGGGCVGAGGRAGKNVEVGIERRVGAKVIVGRTKVGVKMSRVGTTLPVSLGNIGVDSLHSRQAGSGMISFWPGRRL